MDKLKYGHVVIEGWGCNALYLESGIISPATSDSNPVVDSAAVAIGDGPGWDSNIEIYNQELLDKIINAYNKQ